RVDGCLGAPIREVGFNNGVDYAPSVVGLIASHCPANGLAHCRMSTVATHNILGVHNALIAFGVFYRNGNWVLPFLIDFKANEGPTVIRSDARGALLGKSCEVIQDASLVHDQVWEFGDSKFIIQGSGAANDVLRLLRILIPERHLRDFIGFIGNFGSKTEGLEGLYRPGLDAICLTKRQTVRSTLNQASVDVREHRELRRGNHAGGTRAHDEYVHLFWKLFCSIYAISLGGQNAWIFRYIAIVVKLHVALLVHEMSKSVNGGMPRVVACEFASR